MNEEGEDYKVLEPLRHDGTRYEPGDVVELTDEQAHPLLAAKPPVVREFDDAEPRGDDDQVEEPRDPVERHAALKAVMAELEVPEDPKGSDFWTNSGKPDSYALADVMGWDSVSAAERDAAWQEVLAEREESGGGSS